MSIGSRSSVCEPFILGPVQCICGFIDILKQLLDLVFCYCYVDEEIYSFYRVQQIFMQNYAAFMLNDHATCSVQGHSRAPLEFSEVYKYLRKAVFHVL